MCIALSLLGNGSVNTFSRQSKSVGRVVFYEVRIISKECKRLVLPEHVVLGLSYCLRYQLDFNYILL
jgi:hypothetical protein